MNRFIYYLCFLTLFGCQPDKNEVYRSDLLSVKKINDHLFVHISYLNTNSYGLVPCNGMVYIDGDEAIVFDTPVDNDSADDLIGWLSQSMSLKVKAVVITHFHKDCLGGIQRFHEQGIDSYASELTIELANKTNEELPRLSFDDNLELTVGTNQIITRFFGEGHTKDNVVGYIEAEQALFGGCLIKSTKAGKGNLADANTQDWAASVQKIRKTYPDLKVVVPGHGNYGGIELLDYTIGLFQH